MTLLDNRNKAVRAGLSHKQPVPPLLSTFGGSGAAKPRMQKLKVPKAIDDPPQSTDEEDSQLDMKTPNSGAETPQSKGCAIKTLPDTPSKKKRSVMVSRQAKANDSSSGDELATRGDIKSTKFTKAKSDDASRWPTQKKRKESSNEPENETNPSGSKWQRIGDSVSETRRRGPSPTASTRSDEYFKNTEGFIKKKKKKLKMTYKTRSQSSQESVTKKKGT
ncbi:hypothetical protein E4U21_007616 [Claviceps maximensis]|nr:hypothetical protein E4U21_007616 [Claviceps maximensis]